MMHGGKNIKLTHVCVTQTNGNTEVNAVFVTK